MISASYADGALSTEEILREMEHRFANELQLIASLLHYSARHASSREAQHALAEVASRVEVVIDNRIGAQSSLATDLVAVLGGVVQRLAALAGPLGIRIELDVAGEVIAHRKKTLGIALCVNELVTNAIKHAFGREGSRTSGAEVKVSVEARPEAALTVIVEDSGSPITGPLRATGDGRHQGLDLVSRLAAANGGLMIWPDGESKKFEIRF